MLKLFLKIPIWGTVDDMVLNVLSFHKKSLTDVKISFFVGRLPILNGRGNYDNN